MRKYVLYLRVSSAEQGKSGLGLEAQERDIELFLANYAETPYSVVERFVEVHSGKDNERPLLNAAIALAKREKAVLRATKERGTKLGAPKQHLDALAKARQAKARREAQQFSGVILPLRKQGATLRNICEVLNASGMKTSRGGSFHPSLVSRMLTTLEVA